MANIDMTQIVNLTTQIASLQKAAAATTDPSAKAMLQAQVQVASEQLANIAQHQQAQADASANLLNGLGLFATLTQQLGGNAPTIINLFRRNR